MTHYPEPPFLADTFLWQRRGYQLSGTPPAELGAPSALVSPDPWLRLAAVLERAKRGEFQVTRVLRESVDAELHPFLRDVYLELLGDAGTGQMLDTLSPLFQQNSEEVRVAACRAAYCSGYLFLVPLMLYAWHSVQSSDRRGTISFMLSDLLEPTAGPVVANQTLLPEEYSRLILKLVDDLVDTLGTERSLRLGGTGLRGAAAGRAHALCNSLPGRQTQRPGSGFPDPTP